MRNLQRKQWACGLGVKKDGRVSIANTSHLIGFAYVAGRITLRLDGHLMHALNDGALIGTWPAPWLARTCPHCMVPKPATGQAATAAAATRSLQAQRRVHYGGKVVINNQVRAYASPSSTVSGDARRASELPAMRHVAPRVWMFQRRWYPLERDPEAAARLAPEKTVLVVTYCPGGLRRRSKTAARAFEQLGYTNVRVYEGGKADWLQAGLPLHGTRAETHAGIAVLGQVHGWSLALVIG